MHRCMNQTTFTRSLSFRILLATAGFNAIGMGLLGLSRGEALLYVMAIVPLCSIISSAAAVVLAVDRDDDAPALMLLALPFLAGAAFALLHVAPATGPFFGALLALVGAGMMVGSIGSWPFADTVQKTSPARTASAST